MCRRWCGWEMRGSMKGSRTRRSRSSPKQLPCSRRPWPRSTGWAERRSPSRITPERCRHSRRPWRSILGRRSSTTRSGWRIAAPAIRRRPRRIWHSGGRWPSSPTIRYEVSGADALDHGDWKAAADSFRKGIEVAPKEASLHHKLGTALALQGDGRGAIEEFERSIALDPTFAKAHYSLGLILAATGQAPAAIQHFQAALKSQPGYVEARLQLAHTLRRNDQPEASLPHYAQIVKEDARVPEARFGYAAALIRLKRYSEARDYLAEAITIYPNELSFANAEARLLSAAPDDKVRDG